MSDIEIAKKYFFAGMECLDYRDFANAELRFREARNSFRKASPF